MASFDGIVVTELTPIVGARSGRLSKSSRERFGATLDEDTLVGTHSPAVVTPYTPKVLAGVVEDEFLYPDWPDFYAESNSFTRFRNTTQDGHRLKDRFYGQAAKPRFTCGALVPGLAYILTVDLEEGPIGGPFTPYATVPQLTKIFTATASVMDHELYLPIPNQGREIRPSAFRNVRYYGP